MKTDHTCRALTAVASAWLIFTLPVLSGCGGSQGTTQSNRGALHFTIYWPDAAASRLIPVASTSLEFIVLEKRPDTNQDAPIQLARKVASRPPAGVTSTEVTLSNLPSVNTTVQI